MANVAGENIQEVILQAIHALRRRKARPDLERICHTVERKYGKTDFDVAGELDRMVDAETVIKVEYKGDTSYRDAANWCRSRGLQLNSNDATRSILSAIEKVTALKNQEQQNAQQLDGAGQANSRENGGDKGQTPTGQQQSQSQEPVQCPGQGQGEGHDPDFVSDDANIRGATLSEVEKFFVESDPDTKFTRPYLDEALKREVDAKRLYLHIPSGKYVLAKFASENDKDDDQVSTTGQKISRNKTKRGGRPPAVKQKRKRFKKTHGPEWDEKPLVKTSVWYLKCDYCTLPARCNKLGEREELLVCKDCTLKVHPSCMTYSKALAERSRLSPWQCIDCKTCHVCSDAGDADTLLFCDSCDKGYHMACHTPNVEDKPLGKWVCEPCASEDMELGSVCTDVDSLASGESNGSCSLEDKKGATKPSQSSGQLTPDAALTPNQSEVANLPVQSSQSQEASSSGGKRVKVTKERHPASWSLADVAAYLTERGFPEEALAFEEQEIDGNALLLLRRSDVLTGLSFKLGPALKIYKLVSDLQLFHARPHGANDLNGFARSPPAPPKSTSATNPSIAAPTTSTNTGKASKASASAARKTQSPPNRKQAPTPSAKTTAKAKTSQPKKASVSAKTSPSVKPPSGAVKTSPHRKTLAATSPSKSSPSARAAPLENPPQSPNSKRSSASPKGSLNVKTASTSDVDATEGGVSLPIRTSTVTKTSPRSRSPALAVA